MARENLNGTDTLNLAYQKANSNFIELYDGLESQNELSELNDVDTSGATTGDVLQFDGSVWRDSKILLNELDDVVIVSNPPENKQVLQYNSATNKWNNSGLLIDENLDVAISSPANGQVLRFNNTLGGPANGKWQNVNVDALNITLDDLSGVGITSPQVGQVLRYNGSAFVNVDTTGLNITLDQLQGVAITSAQPNQIIQFNGTTWVNVTPTWTADIDAIKKRVNKNHMLSLMGGV